MSARLAIHHARGEIGAGEEIRVESIVGSCFGGEVVVAARVGSHPAVVPRVTGSAHLTGRHEFWIDPADPLGAGFIFR